MDLERDNFIAIRKSVDSSCSIREMCGPVDLVTSIQLKIAVPIRLAVMAIASIGGVDTFKLQQSG
jgi:hypothetical protein